MTNLLFNKIFENWTCGNFDIDKLIQEAQLLAKDHDKVLEWISYDRFNDIKYIAEDKFDKVYRANWIDGYINKWNDENQNWRRKNQNMLVILKNLNNPNNVLLESILDEV